MISLRRPTAVEIAAYRDERVDAEPTCALGEQVPPGFRTDRYGRWIGAGAADFARARDGLQRWRAHRGSGVEVFPAEARVAVGETVAIVTRQMGLWVLAACRVSSVVDEADRFGFTYSTLPDHPECGYESFIVRSEGGRVRFEIEVVSRPGVLVVRLGQPLTRLLQRRATTRYLDALAA